MVFPELDKRLEMMEGSGEAPDASSNSTPTVEMVEEDPDIIETVAFCKNIRNVQVLTEAIRGFQGMLNFNLKTPNRFRFRIRKCLVHCLLMFASLPLQDIG